MKIKTSELTGPALDWAVAKCRDTPVTYHNDGITCGVMRLRPDGQNYDGRYSPSTCWAQGGQLIDLAKLTVRPVSHPERTEHGSDIYRQDGWAAHVEPAAFWITPRPVRGPTALIAICRCYVTSKLGDTVDIPEELL